MTTLTVRRARPGATVQDGGRAGLGHLGVTASGPVDREAHARANRLVGNPETAAALEITFGGLEVDLDEGRVIAVTGAPTPVRVHGRLAPSRLHLPARTTLVLGTPTTGVRTYLAVAGGVLADPVLGSMSTDALTGTGPPPVVAGTVLGLGAPTAPPPEVPLELTWARDHRPDAPIHFRWGPRDDLFEAADRRRLTSTRWRVSGHGDRVGVRLEGAALEVGELGRPSEGMPLGAIQVPPSGEPIVFLADHPVTGGYPVIGVVREADLGLVAQRRPGETIRLAPLQDVK